MDHEELEAYARLVSSKRVETRGVHCGASRRLGIVRNSHLIEIGDMPTYSEPTYRVALTRLCPRCGAQPGDGCRFGPHANLKDPMRACCVPRAMPRDIAGEIEVIKQLIRNTNNEISRLQREMADNGTRHKKLSDQLEKLQQEK